MKVLIINTVCKAGSTGKIVYGLYQNLTDLGHEAYVAYGRGEKFDNSHLIKISTVSEFYIHALLARITGWQGRFSFFATRKLLKLIEQIDPDVVHIVNLHGYYLNENKVLSFLKEKKYATFYLMVDEYPFLGKCCYSYDCSGYLNTCESCPRINDYPKSLFFDRASKIFAQKARLYKDFNTLIFASTRYVISKARTSPIMESSRLCDIGATPIDTESVFFPRPADALRSSLSIPEDNIIILNVAPFSEKRKGCEYYMQLAKRLVEYKNITFVHVGFDVSTSSCPPNFIPIGFVKDQSLLATYFSLADLFVCTSYEDAFPHTCLNALSCGTPVCGFNISGVPDVASPDVGTFVTPMSVEELKTVVLGTHRKSEETVNRCREYAVERFSERRYCEQFLLIIKDQMGNSESVF